MDCSPPGSSVHGIFRQQYWSGLPFPTPGYLPDPEIIQNLYIQLTKTVQTHILEKELCYIKWFATTSGLKKLYTVTSYCWGSLFLFLLSKPSKILILTLFCGASEAVSRFRMKLNISFPATGCQKLIEVDNEWKLRTFCEKRMATEVAADALCEERKGYVSESVAGTISRVSPWSRVSWPMAKFACYWVRDIPVTDEGGLEKESANLYGVALWTPKCFHTQTHTQTVWSVFNLVIMKKGEKDIPGVTDTSVPHSLGPKRARRIRKFFSLSKDDICQYVVRKPINKDGKKPRTKAPKIQHLVTPWVLQHKRRRIALKKQPTKKNKEEAAEYAKLLAKRMTAPKEKRQEQIAKRRRLSSLVEESFYFWVQSKLRCSKSSK